MPTYKLRTIYLKFKKTDIENFNILFLRLKLKMYEDVVEMSAATGSPQRGAVQDEHCWKCVQVAEECETVAIWF